MLFFYKFKYIIIINTIIIENIKIIKFIYKMLQNNIIKLNAVII